MRTALYLRKSRSDEQSESVTDTLQKHKTALLNFASSNNLSIESIYEEVVSGEKLFSRPQMMQLLSDLEQKKFESILCMDIDRLSRGTQKDRGIIFETLRDNQIKIITPRKVYDLENESDEMMYEIYGFVARQELKSITRRLRQGSINSMKSGYHTTDIPFGYQRTYIGKKMSPTLEPHPENSDIVRMIFDMFANQHIGTPTIAETLNAMGVPTRRGAMWRRNTISWILKNPVYIGKIKWKNKNEDIYVDGAHKPIIEESLFNSVQKLISERTHPPANTGQIANPLAGLVHCQNCGGMMIRQAYRKKYNEPRLLCTTPGCIKSTRLDLIESRVLDILKQLLNEYEYEQRQPAKTTADSHTKLLEGMDKSIATAKSQKSKLQDLLEQQVYTIAEYQARSKVLDGRVKELEIKKQEMLARIKTTKTSNEIKREIQAVLDSYTTADAAHKNLLLKKVISKIEYSKSPTARGSDFDVMVILKHSL